MGMNNDKSNLSLLGIVFGTSRVYNGKCLKGAHKKGAAIITDDDSYMGCTESHSQPS